MKTNLGQYHSGSGKSVFVKIVKPRHYFRYFEGWCMSTDALDGMDDKQEILLKVQGQEKVLVTTAGAFGIRGRHVTVGNREGQICLPEKYWKRSTMEYFEKVMEG